MSRQLSKILMLSEACLADQLQHALRVDLMASLVENNNGTQHLRPQELGVLRQEVDKLEQQNAQVQFRLDELEQDFMAPGNRFPQIEANLKKCGRILRDKDWDAASSCSSSSGPDGLDRQPGSRCYLQALQLQLRGLSKAVKRQQARLQEFHDNLWSVQKALAKMVKKQRAAGPAITAGSSPADSPMGPPTPSSKTPSPATVTPSPK